MKDIEYLAGILDADGYLTIRTNKKSVNYFKIVIYSKKSSYIDYISNLLTNKEINHSKIKNKKIKGIRISHHDDLKNFLDMIFPFLRIKRKTAIVFMKALKYREINIHDVSFYDYCRLLINKEAKKGRKINIIISKEELKRIKNIYNSISLDLQKNKIGIKYFAGLFDGDGSVAISIKQSKYSWSVGFKLTITISDLNSLLEDVNYLFNLIGISYGYSGINIQISGWKNVLKISKALIPHVINKKKNLEIMIDAINFKNNLKEQGYGNIVRNLDKFKLFREELKNVSSDKGYHTTYNYNKIITKTLKYKQENNMLMTTLFKRKVLRVGGSLGITIPEEVISTYKVKKGQNLYIMTDAIDEEGFIVIDLMGRNRDEIWKLLKG